MGAYPQGVPPWQEGIDRLLAKIPRLVSTGDITVNDARVIDHLAVLLAFHPEEAPMPSSTITVRFPDSTSQRFRADSFTVDDDGNLTVSIGTHRVAWYPAGSHWGAQEDALEEDRTITEARSA